MQDSGASITWVAGGEASKMTEGARWTLTMQIFTLYILHSLSNLFADSSLLEKADRLL